jgi:hypothetical protein
VVAEIVPAKFRDVGSLEKLRPGGSESGADVKDASPPFRLFAPTIEQANRLVI